MNIYTNHISNRITLIIICHVSISGIEYRHELYGKPIMHGILHYQRCPNRESSKLFWGMHTIFSISKSLKLHKLQNFNKPLSKECNIIHDFQI